MTGSQLPLYKRSSHHQHEGSNNSCITVISESDGQTTGVWQQQVEQAPATAPATASSLPPAPSNMQGQSPAMAPCGIDCAGSGSIPCLHSSGEVSNGVYPDLQLTSLSALPKQSSASHSDIQPPEGLQQPVAQSTQMQQPQQVSQPQEQQQGQQPPLPQQQQQEVSISNSTESKLHPNQPDHPAAVVSDAAAAKASPAAPAASAPAAATDALDGASSPGRVGSPFADLAQRR